MFIKLIFIRLPLHRPFLFLVARAGYDRSGFPGASKDSWDLHAPASSLLWPSASLLVIHGATGFAHSLFCKTWRARHFSCSCGGAFRLRGVAFSESGVFFLEIGQCQLSAVRRSAAIRAVIMRLVVVGLTLGANQKSAFSFCPPRVTGVVRQNETVLVYCTLSGMHSFIFSGFTLSYEILCATVESTSTGINVGDTLPKEITQKEVMRP